MVELEKIYINVHTGSIGTRDEWFYEDENGNAKSAVDEKEVILFNEEDDIWTELI